LLDFPIQIYKLNYLGKCYLINLSSFLGWFFLGIKASNGLEVFLLGLVRLFLLKFKIKGFGFKFVKVRKGLCIRINLTHRFLLGLCDNQKIFLKTKYFFIYKARNFAFVRQAFHLFVFYFKYFAYKKLGVYVKGMLFLPKLSKKKMKF
jgi:hypothetical protein